MYLFEYGAAPHVMCHRPAWAKPDLPPGRAYSDVVDIMNDLDALERCALITGFARPPKVGLGPCSPLRQENDQ